ncbi:ABC transporter substrate-binding protein [Paenibacillus turpanensis]|uniref:ABC transporter substrate-binding protein n=1 Tax=Paenibacillus turpanensis TaxID=2689078 RepID=UPI001FB57E36|nr:extracellular solute-binding protein [Paenibacillus turpanensis]
MVRSMIGKGYIVLLAAVLMLAVVLSGCSGNGAGSGAGSSDSGGSNSGDAGASGGASNAPKLGGMPTDLKGEIVVWDWDEAFLNTMVPEFNKVFPNIKVKYTVVNNNDYMQKLQSGIASGSEVPDVILGEMNFRGQLFDLGVLDNLEKAPYNFSKDQLLGYLPPLLSNTKGELVGVDQSITPAGLGYRRDLAEKYLGTSDPEALSKILTDWDAFIKKGIEVKEKSGGAVTMIASFDDAYRVIKGQTETAYINGTTINLTERMKKPFETLFAMRDAGILGKYEGYTPGWNASFAKGDNIFYPMAPWSPKWNVQANDPDGIGRWGLMAAPEGGFTYGGTSVSVYKGSKNKEAAWAYIYFCYLSSEGMEINYNKFGNMPGITSFFEKHRDWLEKGSELDKYFGDQNLSLTFYDKIVPEVKGATQTKYDSIVATVFGSLFPLWMKDTSIDANAALEKFKAEVKNLAPEATVH